jgi:hypothetical protein
MSIRKIFNQRSGAFCFYCSVDSEELKTLLIVIIGGLVMASISVALGAWLKGYFRNAENPELKEKVLKLEEVENGE